MKLKSASEIVESTPLIDDPAIYDEVPRFKIPSHLGALSDAEAVQVVRSTRWNEVLTPNELTEAANEIQAVSAGQDLPEEVVVAELRAVREAQQKLAAEQAALDVKLAAALDVQGQLLTLMQTRDVTVSEISEAKNREAASRAICAEMEVGFENWPAAVNGSHLQFNLILESAKVFNAHHWFLERVKPWIEARKTKLAEMDQELAKFRKAHGLA